VNTITATRVLDSPLGPLTLTSGDGRLETLHLGRRNGRSSEHASPAALAVLDAAEQQVGEYFAGTRTAFDLPLHRNGTAFQREVWAALAAIPYGTTASYGEVACRIGSPTASQAVGWACGSNPVAIVVPCHRVIGANGRLTGYAGGLDRKRDLLAFEQRDGLLF
jgi:methylated-DNA-[protein]-cysteine S-methyltransferase